MASSKNLGEDQVGLEIVFDEGTFLRDKDRFLASMKKSVDLKIDVDTAAARSEIDAFSSSLRDEKFRVTADADLAVARAQVAAFVSNTHHIEVNVDVDTAAATAQLAAFRASQMAANAASGLGSVGSGLGSAAGGSGGGGFDVSKLFGAFSNGPSGAPTALLGMAGPYGAAATAALGLAQAVGQVVAGTAGLAAVGGAVGLIGSAASASVLGVTSLATSVGTLAGTAALLPAVATGALGIAGTAASILDGIPDALTAMREAQKTVVHANPEIEALKAKRARETVVDAEKDAAKAQIDAIDSVAAARKAANDANLSAAQAYEDAARAQDATARELIDSQLALTDVRRSAADALETINIQLERSAFNETKANKALKVARDNLAEASTNSRLMPEQLGAYASAVKDAEITAKEAADKHKTTQQQFAEADKVRTDSTDAIIAAKQRVTDAEDAAVRAAQKASDAYDNIAETRQEGEKRVADARINSAERVADAEKRANTAAEDYRIQSLEQADRQAASVKKVEDALNRISPAARTALTAVSGFMDDWKSRVSMPAQEKFFDGFSESLKNASDKLLPELESGLGRIAGTLGDSTTTWFDEISNSLDGGVLDRILDNLNTGIKNANDGIQPLVDAFTRLGDTGSEFLPQLGDGFAELATQFADFIKKADESGDLDRWIQDGLDGVSDLGNIALNTAKAFDEIGKAAKAADGLSLGSFSDGMTQFADWLAQPGTQETMKTLFEGGKLFFDNLGESLPAIGQMLSDNAPAFKELSGIFGTIGSDLLTELAQLLSDPAVVAGAKDFANGLKDGIEAIKPALPELGAFLGSFLSFLGAFSGEGGKAFAVFLEQAAPQATILFNGLTDLMPKLQEFLSFLMDFWSVTPQESDAIWSNLTGGAQGTLDFLGGDFFKNWDKTWGDLFGLVTPPDLGGDFTDWSNGLLDDVVGSFGDFDFPGTLFDAFNPGNFFDGLGIDFDNGFGGLIDSIVEAFRNAGIDALNALQDGLSGFDFGKTMDALNPLNVFNFDGGSNAPMTMMAMSADSTFATANAPTSSDFRNYGRAGAGAAAAAGPGKYYNIENLSFSEMNDPEEMYSGFFNRIDLGG